MDVTKYNNKSSRGRNYLFSSDLQQSLDDYEEVMLNDAPLGEVIPRSRPLDPSRVKAAARLAADPSRAGGKAAADLFQPLVAFQNPLTRSLLEVQKDESLGLTKVHFKKSGKYTYI
jgi:hypothetical protein